MGYRKKKKGKRVYLSIYLLCPGGAFPDGFWISVICSSAPPLHSGGCLAGRYPPGFSEATGSSVKLAKAWLVSAGDIANESATANAANAASVRLCVFAVQTISSHNTRKIVGDLCKLFTYTRSTEEKQPNRDQ